MTTATKKLSIIIPVYNVEKYIRTCLKSVFWQGLDEKDYEVIIINDGTTDKSMSVIADIIEQHSNIIVVEQENQGLSVTRNNGIAIATGEYLFMPDSDDLIFPNSIRPLLEKALTTNVDMIIANYKQMSDEEIDIFLQDSTMQKKELHFIETTGEELLDESLCRSYWRYLYRKDFLINNAISFIPGITAQDIPFTNECLLKAKKCLKTSWLLIIYRWGHPSTTFCTYNLKKAKDVSIALSRIWQLSKLEHLTPATKRKQEDIVFINFYALISATTYGHIKDKSVRIEIIDYLKQLAPDLYFRNGAKQRVWSIMYKYAPHTLINLRYWYELSKKKIRKLLNT